MQEIHNVLRILTVWHTFPVSYSATSQPALQIFFRKAKLSLLIFA